MAEPKEIPLMEKIVSLCKRRGFIYQSSEIYGGINGFWDYGPLGAELKRNVKELWWNAMTRQRDDVVGLEATIIMSPEIWKASGHVDTFADLMVECPITNKRFRADQIDPQTGTVYFFKGAEPSEEAIRAIVGNPVSESESIEERQERVSLLDDFRKHQSSHRLDNLVQYLTALANGGNRPAHKLVHILTPYISSCKRSDDSFSVLVQAGKPQQSAEKVAVLFYQKRGVLVPAPILDRAEKVTGDTRHNPENGAELTTPRPFNLMFKTYVGPLESEENIAYLRPETAQAIFAQFKNVLETSRQKVPFGIAQIGKAFRNEVTPRNYTFRSREFEQMELEFFIKPDEAVEAIAGNVAADMGRADLPVGQDARQRVPTRPAEPQPNWGWEAWHKYWVEERIAFYESIGLPRHTLVEYWQKPEELAHYARATVDILFKFPFSKRNEQGELMGEELEGVAARSDFDLSQHARCSGKPMGVFDDDLRTAWAKLPKEKQDELWRRYYENRKKYFTKTGMDIEAASRQATEDANGLAKGQYIPHVIEPSAGVDRLILALICHAYHEDQMPDDKGKPETRIVLRFHPRVAPIKVAVLPLLKNKPDLVKQALAVRDLLRPHLNVYYDDGGAIGRRYRRQDEIGTPFCVTIDFDTLGEKGPELKDTVTLRYRDDGRQERVNISELLPLLLQKIR